PGRRDVLRRRAAARRGRLSDHGRLLRPGLAAAGAVALERATGLGRRMLIKELWAFDGHRIGVRFAYEWHDDSGTWYRSYGNENWEFAEDGLMRARFACINDRPIAASDRRFQWTPGGRPARPP